MIKKSALLILSVFVGFSAFAEETPKYPDMSTVNPTFNDPSFNLSDADKAEENNKYQGRNKNVAKTHRFSQVKEDESVLSKNVVGQRNTSLSSQVENLESTMGELVQKLEDDRLSKAKEHKKTYEENRDKLQETYEIIKDINVNNLGREQDPEVTIAFKCANYNTNNPQDCKSTCEIEGTCQENDDHSIKKCNSYQRLHWTGQRWECLDLFKKNTFLTKCKKGQWNKGIVNGGLVCADIVYNWKETDDWTSCNSEGFKKKKFKCIVVKGPSGATAEKEDCPGDEPVVEKKCN